AARHPARLSERTGYTLAAEKLLTASASASKVSKTVRSLVIASRSVMRLVRFNSLRLPPWRLTVVYVRSTSPRPALSMYGTSARLRMIFLWPWLTRLFTLSFSSSSPSPNVILPLRSSTTTSPTLRSSICMETLPNYACELNIPARRAVPCARDCDLESRREKIDQWSLDAPSARELAGLEAFLAEHGAPL